MANKIIGRIDPNIIGDPSIIDYPDRRQFSDDEIVNKWKSIGHLYVNYTGLLREEYRGVPTWCHDIVNELSKIHEFKSSTLSIYCMPPGTIMPEHSDYYYKYKQINKLTDADSVGRFLVFLDDWKSGHYFELDRDPIVKWKKGDYCMWIGNTSHMAANLGIENRYTFQITVVL